MWQAAVVRNLKPCLSFESSASRLGERMIGQSSEETFCPNSKLAVRGILARRQFLALGEKKAKLIGSRSRRRPCTKPAPKRSACFATRLDSEAQRIPSMVIVRLEAARDEAPMRTRDFETWLNAAPRVLRRWCSRTACENSSIVRVRSRLGPRVKTVGGLNHFSVIFGIGPSAKRKASKPLAEKGLMRIQR